jgi:hypothetical protein
MGMVGFFELMYSSLTTTTSLGFDLFELLEPHSKDLEDEFICRLEAIFSRLDVMFW